MMSEAIEDQFFSDGHKTVLFMRCDPKNVEANPDLNPNPNLGFRFDISKAF